MCATKIIRYFKNYLIFPHTWVFLIHPLNFDVFIKHQFSSHFLTINILPFLIFAKGFEKLDGSRNKILSLSGIIEFICFNCETCIQPLLFFTSTILRKFSFLSICFIGRFIFLYTYFIGDSRLGPYLTLTLFFFNDRKISFAKQLDK